MTKIFCDIADIREIKKFNKKNIVKGFTTNPSLMRKAGAKDYSFYSKKILKLTNKPVSCEVFAELTWKPKNFVKVDDENAEKVLKIIEALEESDDVQNVSSNFEISDEILKKLSN